MHSYCYKLYKIVAFLSLIGCVILIRDEALCLSFSNNKINFPFHQLNKPPHSRTQHPFIICTIFQKTDHRISSANEYACSLPMSISSKSIAINSTKRKRRRSFGKNYVKTNPGAYANYSEEQLKHLTNDLLENCIVGEMTPAQLHEVQKLISSWSKRGAFCSGEMSELLLRRMIEEIQEDNKHVKLTVNLFNSVLNAWVKCGDKDGIFQASSVLDMMDQQTFPDSENHNNFSKCYITVLDGWCKSNKNGAVESANGVLRRLTNLPLSQVETKHFNAVMNAWVESNTKDAPEKVQQLLDQIIHLHEKGNKRLRPNTTTYNILIKALIKSGGGSSMEKANRVLNQMEESSDAGSYYITPDKISYTSVLLGWAKSDHPRATEEADHILSRMATQTKRGYPEVKPDTMTYNIFLNTLAVSGKKDSVEQCLNILTTMENLYESGHQEIKPDVISYNTAINCLAANSNLIASSKALALLKRMERSHQCDQSRAKPDVITYNTVLKTLARSKESGAPYEAEKILIDLEKNYLTGCSDVKPDLCTYNIVMSCWANSGETDAGVMAELIFNRLKSFCEVGNLALMPDTTTYNTLLTAWSRTPSPYSAPKAQIVFDEMLDMCNVGSRHVDVTAQSFVSVISAWSKSQDPFKAEKAYLLLGQMKELSQSGQKGFEPNTYVYTSVLNACSYTFGKAEYRERAMEIAIKTFKEMQKSTHARPNHVSYGTFLRACRKLLREDDVQRDTLMETVFHQCKMDGQVGELVLKQLQYVKSPGFKMKLFGQLSTRNNLVITDVPGDWTSNVRENQSYRRSKSLSSFNYRYGIL